MIQKNTTGESPDLRTFGIVTDGAKELYAELSRLRFRCGNRISVDVVGSHMSKKERTKGLRELSRCGIITLKGTEIGLVY